MKEEDGHYTCTIECTNHVDFGRTSPRAIRNGIVMRKYSRMRRLEFGFELASEMELLEEAGITFVIPVPSSGIVSSRIYEDDGEGIERVERFGEDGEAGGVMDGKTEDGKSH